MGGKKDDITIIVAFIQEKLYNNNPFKNNLLKNRSFYHITQKIDLMAPKAINPTEEFIKNFENLNLNNASQNLNNQNFLSSDKNAYLTQNLDNGSNNLNNSFH